MLAKEMAFGLVFMDEGCCSLGTSISYIALPQWEGEEKGGGGEGVSSMFVFSGVYKGSPTPASHGCVQATAVYWSEEEQSYK